MSKSNSKVVKSNVEFANVRDGRRDNRITKNQIKKEMAAGYDAVDAWFQAVKKKQA